MNKKLFAAILMVALTVAFVAPAAFGQGAPNAEKMGWRLGCQAWSFNKFTLFEAIDKTASIGLKYIEAFPGQALSPEKKDVKFDHTISKEIQDEVKAKLASAGVTLVNYGVVGIPNNEDEAKKVFEFAKAMGIETLCAEPAKAQIPMLDKLTKKYGVNIAIHNHPKPSLYWSPENVLEAVKGASPRIGSCADTGHWARSGLVSLDSLKKLEGHIVSLHFKDINAAEKEAHDVIWGTGVCDARAMMEELKRQGVKAVFSIEYEHNWDNNVPDIAKCVEWFDKTCAELNK